VDRSHRPRSCPHKVSDSVAVLVAEVGRQHPRWGAKRIRMELLRKPPVEAALDQAREAAGDRDVRIAGGGATILEYVNAGLIDEFSIALSPVLFGSASRVGP
jgi:dihydrofolate reductase